MCQCVNGGGCISDVEQDRPLYVFRRGLEVNGVRYEKCNVSNSILENENGKEKAWLDWMCPHVNWKNS